MARLSLFYGWLIFLCACVCVCVCVYIYISLCCTAEINTHCKLYVSTIFLKRELWSARCGAAEVMPTRSHEVAGSVPVLAQWDKDPALLWAGVIGHRCSSDLMLLWLWCRLAAVAPIRPLAWEPPYATGAALRKKEKKIFLLAGGSYFR